MLVYLMLNVSLSSHSAGTGTPVLMLPMDKNERAKAKGGWQKCKREREGMCEKLYGQCMYSKKLTIICRLFVLSLAYNLQRWCDSERRENKQTDAFKTHLSFVLIYTYTFFYRHQHKRLNKYTSLSI